MSNKKTDDIYLEYEIIENENTNVLYALAGSYNISCFKPFLRPLKEKFSLVLMGFERDKSAKEFTLEKITESIEEFRKGNGHNKVSILGHSLGGAIAQKYASDYPSNVEKLFLANTKCGAPNFPASYNAKILFLLIKSYFLGIIQKRDFKDIAVENFPYAMKGYYFSEKHGEYADKYAESLKSKKLESLMEEMDILKKRKPKKFEEEASKIRCRTLIIAGKYDKIISLGESERLNELIKSSELKMLDSGHFSFMEKPGDFIRHILEF